MRNDDAMIFFNCRLTIEILPRPGGPSRHPGSPDGFNFTVATSNFLDAAVASPPKLLGA